MRSRKRPHDFSIIAHRVVEEVAGELADAGTNEQSNEGKNPAAVALGRLGGKVGGVARAKKLSAAQRSDIARKAARARWDRRNTT